MILQHWRDFSPFDHVFFNFSLFWIRVYWTNNDDSIWPRTRGSFTYVGKEGIRRNVYWVFLLESFVQLGRSVQTLSTLLAQRFCEMQSIEQNIFSTKNSRFVKFTWGIHFILIHLGIIKEPGHVQFCLTLRNRPNRFCESFKDVVNASNPYCSKSKTWPRSVFQFTKHFFSLAIFVWFSCFVLCYPFQLGHCFDSVLIWKWALSCMDG